MNGPVAGMSAPWGGLVAELREVIVTARPRADADLIERACEVAAWCHQGQLRYSGDPYITHPVAVATILARLSDAGEVDDQTLCAAILHDTVEDTPYTLAALRRDFGTEIAAMVAGLMALDRLGRRPGRQVTQVMTTILSADARVVATKLADRLHNMQTLQVLPPAKQQQKAREVLDTFLPVAEQLSLPALGSELQALAFAALIRNQPLRPFRRRVIVALDGGGPRPARCFRRRPQPGHVLYVRRNRPHSLPLRHRSGRGPRAPGLDPHPCKSRPAARSHRAHAADPTDSQNRRGKISAVRGS